VNELVLSDADTGDVVASNISRVLWCGQGSPYPTPPGGPWVSEKAERAKFGGKCLYIKSDRENEVFFHKAQKKSYGCVIVNPTDDGLHFFNVVYDNVPVFYQHVIDDRPESHKTAFPIDYESMTEKIV
jgi:hypothetical protein